MSGELVKKFTQEEVQAMIDLAIAKITGAVPVHEHRCPEGHRWLCTSPYCEDVTAVPRACVEHGGPPPIVKGLEPWRAGR